VLALAPPNEHHAQHLYSLQVKVHPTSGMTFVMNLSLSRFHTNVTLNICMAYTSRCRPPTHVFFLVHLTPLSGIVLVQTKNSFQASSWYKNKMTERFSQRPRMGTNERFSQQPQVQNEHPESS